MFKREDGATLLSVVLLITIFTLLGVSLLVFTVNTSEQISTTGESLQAENLADMGALQLKEDSFYYLKNNPEMDLATVCTLLKNKINERLLNRTFYLSPQKSTPSYKITAAAVSSKEDDKTETILVDFSVVGNSNDGRQKSLTGTIKAKRAKGSIFPTSPDGTVHFYEAEDNEWDKDDQEIINDSVYFHDGITMNSNSSLQVNFNLYSEGTTTVGSNSDLIIMGDAYIQVVQISENRPGSGNRGLMCVEKTLYVYGTNIPAVSLKGEGISCADIQNSHPAKNGIFVGDIMRVEPRTGGTAWEKENITIHNVVYK